ncbi:MAG TPA: 3'-5' exonuclease [Paludibacteraceae bacterium]|nr:3'-5' exonuclease [Paludibacteraceae bacterium]HRU63625.1 3'-5' exonuclease [Paludibacteraceae bacterium]
MIEREKDTNFDFLNELNESQRLAVEYTDGPSLVIAGAGSGKTRVLTYKVAYLLKKGFPPSSILALTFTNKAAREMKERIAEIVGNKIARYLWMGTFHSIFSRILRAEAQYTGFTQNFSIYDQSDSKSLLRSIIKEMELDSKIYTPGLVQSRISMAKNNLITPKAYAADYSLIEKDRKNHMGKLCDVYQTYCIRCKQANAMDFDDLLLQTNLLFRDHPEVLQKYQQLFRYILVDEYQDTNFAQYLIIKKLAERHKNICVVGDDAQSIYSFRGANIDNIFQFKNSYQDAKIFKLEQNYRSTKTIVKAANSLIKKNKEQIQKTIFSEKEPGAPIKVFSTYTDLEEGIVVANCVANLYSENFQYQDIAILYRTNSQSRVLEEALRNRNIPYRIYGGLSFYERKEIKDVIAYCRLICNQQDEEALKRIINYPTRGIGETTLNKIIECAQQNQISLWEVISNLAEYKLPINSRTVTKIEQFKELINVFVGQVNTQNAYDLVNQLINVTGIFQDIYSDNSPENLSKQENIQELLKALHEFCERKEKEEDKGFLPDFLSEISLLTDQDTDKSEGDRVTLMTVHSAKGLEFRAVFIVGMEEQLFPSIFSIFNERELEEERRLFYVAITRAKEHCFISYAKSRFRNGKTYFSEPSRFIKDIDKQYLDLPSEETISQQTSTSWDDTLVTERKHFYQQSNGQGTVENSFSQKRLVKLNDLKEEKVLIEKPSLPVGSLVKHSQFGIGKVIETCIVNGNERAEIDFGEKGKKSLLLKFAKLEVLK